MTSAPLVAASSRLLSTSSARSTAASAITSERTPKSRAMSTFARSGWRIARRNATTNTPRKSAQVAYVSRSSALIATPSRRADPACYRAAGSAGGLDHGAHRALAHFHARVGAEGVDLPLVPRDLCMARRLDDRPPLRVDDARERVGLLPAIPEHVTEQVDHVRVGVVVVIQQDQVEERLEVRRPLDLGASHDPRIRHDHSVILPAPHRAASILGAGTATEPHVPQSHGQKGSAVKAGNDR